MMKQNRLVFSVVAMLVSGSLAFAGTSDVTTTKQKGDPTKSEGGTRAEQSGARATQKALDTKAGAAAEGARTRSKAVQDSMKAGGAAAGGSHKAKGGGGEAAGGRAKGPQGGGEEAGKKTREVYMGAGERSAEVGKAQASIKFEESKLDPNDRVKGEVLRIEASTKAEDTKLKEVINKLVEPLKDLTEAELADVKAGALLLAKYQEAETGKPVDVEAIKGFIESAYKNFASKQEVVTALKEAGHTPASFMKNIMMFYRRSPGEMAKFQDILKNAKGNEAEIAKVIQGYANTFDVYGTKFLEHLNKGKSMNYADTYANKALDKFFKENKLSEEEMNAVKCNCLGGAAANGAMCSVGKK